MKTWLRTRAAVAASGSAPASGVTLVTVITAIGTALAAFQLFQPKLAIGLAMKRETGRVEPAFSWFYTVPQCVALIVVLVVFVVLLFGVVHQLAPTYVPAYLWLQKVLAFLTLENLIPVLVVGVVMAAFIQLNILSWVFLLFGRALSWLSLGRLAGAFGAEGSSVGWIQAWCVCCTWDKGQPLLVSQEQVERVGDELLRRIASSDFPGKHFAPKPTNATKAGAANIALIGGILEEAHGAHRWKKPPSWRDFYSILAQINDANKMFEPDHLMKFDSGSKFSELLRSELAARMQAKNFPVPDGDYYGAASYVAKAWTLLHASGGSILRKVPFYASAIGSKLYWLNRRLTEFPLLRGHGMREQIIKLMTRWDATPWAKSEGFIHPFSKTQAWLLLQEGVLTTLPEQKDVTFWSNGDVAISRLACKQVFERVRRTAAEGLSAEARNVSQRFPEFWDLIAAGDFSLWSWAQEESKKGRDAEWKGWRWKIVNGRASKLA